MLKLGFKGDSIPVINVHSIKQVRDQDAPNMMLDGLSAAGLPE
jgi:hypothetical protein